MPTFNNVSLLNKSVNLFKKMKPPKHLNGSVCVFSKPEIFLLIEYKTYYKNTNRITSHLIVPLERQNEDSLVAGTSEGFVVQFQFISKVLGKDDKEWVRTRTFKNHTHDIRAVAEITTAVVSGGEFVLRLFKQSCFHHTNHMTEVFFFKIV